MCVAAIVIAVTVIIGVVSIIERHLESKETKFLRRAYKGIRKQDPEWDWRYDTKILSIVGPHATDNNVYIDFAPQDPRSFTWLWSGHRKEPPYIDSVEYGLVLKIRDLIEELEPKPEQVTV